MRIIHKHIRTYIHTKKFHIKQKLEKTNSCKHMYICMYIYIYIYIYRLNAYTYMVTPKHAYSPSHTHTHIHTHIHSYTHSYTHTTGERHKFVQAAVFTAAQHGHASFVLAVASTWGTPKDVDAAFLVAAQSGQTQVASRVSSPEVEKRLLCMHVFVSACMQQSVQSSRRS